MLTKSTRQFEREIRKKSDVALFSEISAFLFSKGTPLPLTHPSTHQKAELDETETHKAKST